MGGVRRRLLALAVLVGLAGAVHGLHERARTMRAAFPEDEDLLYLPPPEHLAWMSLGYREALADLIWVRALVFAGTHLTDDEIVWTDRYTEAITYLAPRFHRPYLWGGISAIYVGGKAVDRSMVERAIRIYRMGLAQFPESHELLYRLGMLLLHQVPITPGYTPEEIAEAKAEGARLIRKAAAFGADPLVRQYAASLIDDYAGRQLAIQFLRSQILEAEDEHLREMLRAKLAEIGGSEALDEVERLRRAFVAERDRAMPYVPEALWAIIRPDEGPFGPEATVATSSDSGR
ncbi:MAG: hypothetical protein D6705_05930 [Deltaproteobacteria bacterium]|nr:MAG: hypothetical protein D6705_05930 [Deltaproteobacteria bacterium]